MKIIGHYCFLLIVSGACVDGQSQSVPKSYVKNSEIIVNNEFYPGQLTKDEKSYYFLTQSKDPAKTLRVHRLQVSREGKITKSTDSLFFSNNYADVLRFGSLSFSGNLKHGVFSASKSSLWQGNELFSLVKSGTQYSVSSRLEALKEARKATACPWLSYNGKHLYFIKENKIYHSYRSDVKSDFNEMDMITIDLRKFVGIDIISLFLNKKETILYLMTSDNEIFICTRSNKKSGFSVPSIFLQLKNEQKKFFTGMSISNNQKFAIFYMEDTSTNLKRIVSYLLNPTL